MKLIYSGDTQSYRHSNRPFVDTSRPKSKVTSTYDPPFMEGSPFGGREEVVNPKPKKAKVPKEQSKKKKLSRTGWKGVRERIDAIDPKS